MKVRISMAAIKKLTAIVILLIVSTVIGMIGFAHYKVTLPNHLTSAKLIVVNSGSSFFQFSTLLVDNGIIDDVFWLKLYVKVHRESAKIKAGTYQIQPSETVKELLNRVVKGEEHQFLITFIEGTTFKQWLSQLAVHPHINHTISVASVSNQHIVQQLNLPHKHPEGLFFPDTYLFTDNTSDVDILKRAHKKMANELNRQWQNKDQNLPYDNAYQALIMASIIEKESGRHAEHEVISSVFVNRLHKRMRLQTDPTIIYGLGDRYKGDIKRSHKKEKTAYNTYRINGLPPTPIAMPGKSALHAALHPAATDYLYFVSNGNGKHIFSTNLADHNKAVVKYQLKRSTNEVP